FLNQCRCGAGRLSTIETVYLLITYYHVVLSCRADQGVDNDGHHLEAERGLPGVCRTRVRPQGPPNHFAFACQAWARAQSSTRCHWWRYTRKSPRFRLTPA